jgi:hypothetical protein
MLLRRDVFLSDVFLSEAMLIALPELVNIF